MHGAILGFAVAFGVFTLAFALAPRLGGEVLWGGVNVVEVPVPRLASTGDIYRMGESGSVWLEFFNPSKGDVTFTPPSQVTFHVEYPGDVSFVSTVCNISWERMNYTLKPGKSMNIYRYDFTASRPGNMTVVINGREKTVTVLPSAP